MTQEEKELLLRDLCARLPYNVIVKISHRSVDGKTGKVIKEECHDKTLSLWNEDLLHEAMSNIKPYLRPMSSMTEEEFGFLQEHLPYDFTRIYSGKFDLIDDIHIGNSVSIDDMVFLLDCLNKWHFDYRGLIEKGLALEAPEEMYKIN